MSNLLDFLITLANTPYHRSDIDSLIQKQSTEVQLAFYDHNMDLLKYQLSDNKNKYFYNEKDVVQIQI